MYKDSTYIFFENDNILSNDSLIQYVDSVKPALQTTFEGFDGLAHVSLPQTENWVFGVLLGLFFLLILSIRLYPSLLSEDLRSIFRVKERSSIFSNPEGSDLRLRGLYLVFSVCVISLYAYFFLFESGSSGFTLLCYLRFLIATIAFFFIKYFFILLLNFVFFDTKMMKIALKNYNDIVIFGGFCLFPLLILAVYSPPAIGGIVQIVSVIVFLIAVTITVLKLFLLFFTKLLDILYILLYLCTLEILPVLALFQAYKMFV